jgi:hypothetical protein
MQIVTQLAVFLANRPGALARLCEALALAGINIHAISTSDTVDHTVVRLVVTDPRKALFLLEERGTLVVENDVLLIEIENQPGALADIAGRLAQAQINIEYLYSTAPPAASRVNMILRVSDARRALRVLHAKPRAARRPSKA